MINIEIYKLVTCCKWSDVIGQTHPTSWQFYLVEFSTFPIQRCRDLLRNKSLHSSHIISVECIFQMASLENVFQVCLAVESTPATVKTDKERIMHLQKLNFEYVASRLPVGLSEQVGLKFFSFRRKFKIFSHKFQKILFYFKFMFRFM